MRVALVAILASLTLLALSSAMPAYSAENSDHTVTCKDGSTSKGGQGACSQHGGMQKGGASASAQDKKGDEKKDPELSGTPTAKCKDGAVSHSKQPKGACSQHGGVVEWFDKK